MLAEKVAVRWLSAVFVLAVTHAAHVARADARAGATCDERTRPWIRFEEPKTGAAPAGLEAIVRHVRAELALKQIDLCTTGVGEPIATVSITATSPDSVRVMVEISDSLTKKRVSRVLDLRSLPRDARPLAIAVGTDELLLASWVELAVHRDKGSTEAPTQVVTVVSERIRPEPTAEAATALTFESFDGGQRFYGIDARGALWLLDRLAATVRLGVRRGFVVQAPNGTIDSSAWLVGLGTRVAVTPRSRPFGIDVLGRVDTVQVAYVSEPDPDVVARSRQGTAVVAAGGAAARWAPTERFRILLDATLGAPLRPLRAADTGSTVTAVSGVSYAVGGELALLF